MMPWPAASKIDTVQAGVITAATPQDVVRSIAEHAMRAPNAAAIVSDGVRLTYGELESQAARVANCLARQGILPGTHVGIYLQRPAEMLTGIIGVLKFGSVAVPLDCADPYLRVRAILKAAALPWIVTEQRLADNVADLAHCIRIGEIECHTVSKFVISDYQPGEDEAGCVIYRGDSAGGFKGFTLRRRTLSARSFGEHVDILAGDRIVQPVTFLHDMAGFEMLRAVSSGATVICVPLFPALAPGALAAMLEDHAATRVFLSAKVLERLAREFPSSLTRLRVIIVEDCSTAREMLRRSLPPALHSRIYGAYGAVQTGGCCLLYSIDNPGVYVASGITVRLLDERLHEVPESVPGEICVGTQMFGSVGANASKEAHTSTSSYLVATRGTDFWHTGDYARYTSEGAIEFVGRRDRQLTVNSLRIEPQEVEAVLRQQPGVRDATVSVRAGPAQRGGRSLVAFVSTVPGEVVIPADLQRSLKDFLPAAMIPSVVINPKSAMEEVLLDIWREVLKKEQIGTRDNFLDVGGHSMALIKVAALIQERLGLKLPVIKLLANPTISALANELSKISPAANSAV